MKDLENLWPSTLGKIEVVPPVHILAKQAEYFNDMMQNILVAKISSREGTLGEGISIVHDLKIHAPTLGAYRLTVLRMLHGNVRFYPVQIFDAVREKKFDSLNNESDLLEALREILGSNEMNKAISALRAQATFESVVLEDSDLPF